MNAPLVPLPFSLDTTVMSLSALKAEDINQYLCFLAAAGDVKPSTVRYSRTVINQMYQYFENPSVDTVPANIDAIKGFIDVKLDKGLNLDKANKIKAILAEHGIAFEEGDFKFYVNSTNLKETLNQSPEGLDAWTLQEKDIVTIKK